MRFSRPHEVDFTLVTDNPENFCTSPTFPLGDEASGWQEPLHPLVGYAVVYTVPSGPIATHMTSANWPSASPAPPHARKNSPLLENTWIRLFP